MRLHCILLALSIHYNGAILRHYGFRCFYRYEDVGHEGIKLRCRILEGIRGGNRIREVLHSPESEYGRGLIIGDYTQELVVFALRSPGIM